MTNKRSFTAKMTKNKTGQPQYNMTVLRIYWHICTTLFDTLYPNCEKFIFQVALKCEFLLMKPI
jgi:hypothetical protein